MKTLKTEKVNLEILVQAIVHVQKYPTCLNTRTRTLGFQRTSVRCQVFSPYTYTDFGVKSYLCTVVWTGLKQQKKKTR